MPHAAAYDVTIAATLPEWARDEAARLGPRPAAGQLRLWVDLDNLPHVPVFAPIIALLRARGHWVDVTARDSAFTAELLRLHDIPHRLVGRYPGKATWRKVLGTLGRAVSLARREGKALSPARIFGRRAGWRPDAAIGHGSRSGAIGAWLAGVPALTMFDYEHVHAAAFLKTCRRILMPDALPDASLPTELRDVQASWEQLYAGGEGDGAPLDATRARCTLGRFPGYKEQLYLDRFVPEPAFRERVLRVPDDKVMVVLREPASTAHYHHPESDLLYAAALDWLRRHEAEAVGVLLPRHAPKSAAAERSAADGPPPTAPPANLRVLDKPVDGLQLLAAADLVISGGGTMNREAALLGVPTCSIFRGKPGALDAALEAEGRLRRLATADEVAALPCARRERSVAPPSGEAGRAAVIREIEALASRR